MIAVNVAIHLFVGECPNEHIVYVMATLERRRMLTQMKDIQKYAVTRVVAICSLYDISLKYL